jgi:hypothetical protein
MNYRFFVFTYAYAAFGIGDVNRRKLSFRASGPRNLMKINNFNPQRNLLIPTREPPALRTATAESRPKVLTARST